MKTRWLLGLVVFVFALSLAWLAAAPAEAVFTPGLTTDDVHVDLNDPDTNFGGETNMLLDISNFAGCSATTQLWFKFDLADARMDLTGEQAAFNISFPPGGDTVFGFAEVYGSTNVGWTEGTLTYNNKPALTTGVLASAVIPSAPGGINFSGPDLAAFLEANKGNEVTLVVIGDCDIPPGGPSLSRSVSRNNATLGLYTTNNVDLLSMSAVSSSPAYVMAGLGLLLVALAVGGMLLLRRRTAF